MLVECSHCHAVINNHRDYCPWCCNPRQPMEEERAKKQYSLLAFMVGISIVGVWLGFSLQETFR